MGSSLGDIFWDLAPWITYEPGYDLGCSIYVANPSDTQKEYALMSRLSQSDTVISEEVLPVFGYSWFKVEPGDFVRLRGALRFEESDAELAILLVERETEEIADSVVTVLVSPSTAGVFPPTWPDSGGTTAISGFDWSLLLAMMLPVMMLGMVTASTKPAEKEEKENIKSSIEAVRRDLPDKAIKSERKSADHGRQPVLVG
ncbi:hypothetical protein [Dehalococcoides mccartyi]|nr:hypothetical protein [Dehalococcoides mccartyi]